MSDTMVICYIVYDFVSSRQQQRRASESLLGRVLKVRPVCSMVVVNLACVKSPNIGIL